MFRPAVGDFVDGRGYARKYLRIVPDIPLFGSVSIVRIGSRAVHTGSARIRIVDLSPGGLRFISSLRLPPESDIDLEVGINLEDMDFCLLGCIVHGIGTEVSEYSYGLRFINPDRKLREALMKLFNNMSMRLNRRIFILRL
jgi:hypothetical protein